MVTKPRGRHRKKGVVRGGNEEGKNLSPRVRLEGHVNHW